MGVLRGDGWVDRVEWLGSDEIKDGLERGSGERDGRGETRAGEGQEEE